MYFLRGTIKGILLMRRREFLSVALAPPRSRVQSTVLVHEHVLVDFRGRADQLSTGYDSNAVFQIVKPHLEEIKRLGCVRFQDCTPEYIGRNPSLLRRLADAPASRSGPTPGGTLRATAATFHRKPLPNRRRRLPGAGCASSSAASMALSRASLRSE